VPFVILAAALLFALWPFREAGYAAGEIERLHRFWMNGAPFDSVAWLQLGTYQLFGLNPVAWRSVWIALACVHAVLAAVFAFRVSQSDRILLGGAALVGLPGSILCMQDVRALLGSIAILAALLVRAPLPVRTLAIAVITLLLAERSLLLPAVLIADEAVFHGRRNYVSVWRWLKGPGLPIVLAIGIVVLLPVSRSAGSVVGPRWGLELAVAIAAGAVALWMRTRVLSFAAAWIAIAAALHAPLVMILAPAMLIAGHVAERVLGGMAWRISFALLLGLGVVVSFYAGRRFAAREKSSFEPYRATISKLAAVHERVRPGGSVLIIGDPFPTTWDMYFLTRLHYRDPELQVGLTRSLNAEPRGDAADIWELRLVFDPVRAVPYRLAPGDEE
jgi:hypothetical protein